MKKNYLSKTAMSANPLALIVAKKSWKNMTTTWLLLLFTVFGFTDALQAQIAQRGLATTAISTNNTITITKPTGVVAGDIMIANITSIDDNDLFGNNANLAGWTIISASDINGNNERRCTILYKIAGTTEPLNYTFNVSNGTGTTDNTSGAIIAYSGVNNTTPFDVTPGTMSSGAGNPVTASAITTVTANAAVIFLSALRRDDRDFDTWSTALPQSLTETYDYSPNNYPGIGSAWTIQSTPGSTGAGSCTLNNNSPYVGILIALRPTPPPPPTITSLGAASGCVGSTLTINGTNLLGATAVTIGGTAAASYVVNSATQITATIGTGATGTIQVTTPGGSATSAATFTVNTGPIITTQPVATSICTTGTGTFTVVATGATTYQWRRNGVNLTNTAPYSGVNTATLTITNPAAVNAGNFDVIVGNGSCTTTSSLAALTVTSVPNIVATPAPTNGATGVCYSGFGAITAISWATSAGATNYDVYFGAGSLPGGITANVTTNSYPFGTLTPNTTYYWRVVARNACGSAASSATFTFTTSATPICYCTPTTSQNLEHITGVASEGTINDVSNPSGYSVNGYGNYTSIVLATQIPGGSININLSLTDIAVFERQFVRTWVDWNNDGDFDDPGELVYTTGTTATGTTSYGFLVPAAQALGNYRMRIKTRNIGPPFSGNSTYDSCSSYNRGETEDYTIRVIADCPAKITGITPGSACGPTNTVTLSATMSAGSTQIRWYDALTGGSLVGTGASFTTPVLSSSTTYYVTASNGSCETIHRTPIKATILSTTDITITPSVPEVCGEDNVVSISALGDNIKETIHTQDFESGLSGYTINTTGDTTPTSGTAPDAPWSIKPSPYQTTTNVWKPAINSGPVGTVGNRFAFTTSDYSGTDFTTTITSPAINVSAYTSLTLTFDHFFSRYVDDLGTIQASTDNGATWSTVNTFTAKDGSASKFKPILLNLTPYTGVTQLRIRFVYYGSYDDG